MRSEGTGEESGRECRPDVETTEAGCLVEARLIEKVFEKVFPPLPSVAARRHPEPHDP